MPSTQFSRTGKWLLRSPPVEWAIMQLREMLIGALRQGPIPQHVAFVMDGNRRYARKSHIETVEGHNLGFEALARILEVCYKSGVKVVTIYAFSIENFKRSKYEVDSLMEMAMVKLQQLLQHGALLERYGACIKVLGQRELIKPDLRAAIDRAEKSTATNKKATLNVCFPYTSRDEITTAIKSTIAEYSSPISNSTLAPQNPLSQLSITPTPQSPSLSSTESESLSSGSSSTTLSPDTSHLHENGTSNSEGFYYLDPETITSESIAAHLFTAGTPPLDLLIRTSGVERLSDFMLWQCHEKTDIVFLECLWPDFDLWGFLPVLVEWQWRKRKGIKEGAFGVVQPDVIERSTQVR
ncbi:MAG: cis-prenyltransferase [Vezdaea aestivalis]|nr:MAG: cis-prenyltransferase [Vezdaea aestivalis]